MHMLEYLQLPILEVVEITPIVHHFTMEVIYVLSDQHAIELIRFLFGKLLEIKDSLMTSIRLGVTHKL